MNHKHILVRATGLANPPRDPQFVIEWLTELVRKVDMLPLLPAQAVYCDDVGNEGITGFVVIKTSHCSIHVWSETAEPFAQMDLYSCKDFDPMAVIDHLEAFAPLAVEALVIDRNGAMRESTRIHFTSGLRKGDV